jgi:dGTPase
VSPFVTAAQGLATTDGARLVYEVNRRVITAMIDDAVTTARRRVGEAGFSDADDVVASARPVIVFSDAMARDLAGLKHYLFTHVYRHPRVMRVMTAAETIVRDLVTRYVGEPQSLPAPWRARAEVLDAAQRAALVRDFVAGMTDRYAISEHRRLFARTPELG